MKIQITDYFLNPENLSKPYTLYDKENNTYCIRYNSDTNGYCITLGSEFAYKVVDIPKEYIHAHTVILNTDQFKISEPVYTSPEEVSVKFYMLDQVLTITLIYYKIYGETYTVRNNTDLIHYIKLITDLRHLNDDTRKYLNNIIKNIQTNIMSNNINEVPTPMVEHAKYWQCPICKEYTAVSSNVCCKCGYNRNEPDYKTFENLESSTVNPNLKPLND